MGVHHASFSAPIVSSSTPLPSSPGLRVAAPINAYSAYARATMPDFIRAYQTLAKRPPSASSVLGYDAATVALEGLRRAIKTAGGKRPTRAGVALATHGVPIENALSGPLRFNRAGDLL